MASVAERIKQRLEEFTHDLESGEKIEDKYTCRKVEFCLKPIKFMPAAVRETRKQLGASQNVFAMFLGVATKTIQAWEQGKSAPNPMACRFLEEIRRDPVHWRERLSHSVVAK